MRSSRRSASAPPGPAPGFFAWEIAPAWVLLAAALAACVNGGSVPAPADLPASLPSEAQATASPVSGPLISSTGMQIPAEPGDSECLLRATFLQDVAIPDNTSLQPETPFTKSWRLRNDGSCVWDGAYALTFLGGARMGAPRTTPLTHTVLPGGTVDLSLEMIAPDQPGAYQGFWKLQDPQGRLFGVGDGGRLSFWVKVAVLPEPMGVETLSPNPDQTADLAPTPLQEVLVSGSAALPPGVAFDLDLGQVQDDAGADIVWQGSARQADLSGFGSARIGRPRLLADSEAAPQCRDEPHSAEPVAAPELHPGWRVCYWTDQGRSGYLVVVEAGEALRFEYTTWAE